MAEKIIEINDVNVKFVVNGLTPVKYMSEFGSDFIQDLMKLEKSLKGQGEFDTLSFYRMAHIAASSADKTIGTLEEWLESFEEGFPVFDVISELMPLLQRNLMSSKKDNLVRKK